MKIALKRVYEAAHPSDGFRILVDRLWPRGISKEKAALDLWLKEIAPSNELRKWFGHDPDKWAEFKARYFKELDANPEALASLQNAVPGKGTVVLVYGAKDEEHNNAIALLEYLEAKI